MEINSQSFAVRLPSSVLCHLLKARRAFTLIELLVVITIIGILAGIVLSVSGFATRKGDRARAIADLENIKNGLEEYRVAYGTYPINGLAADNSLEWSTNLWVKPIADGRGAFLTGKFLTNEATGSRLLDPWGNDYRYLHNASAPYATNNNSNLGYDLWSLGPNAVSNSDDITNWKGDF